MKCIANLVLGKWHSGVRALSLGFRPKWDCFTLWDTPVPTVHGIQAGARKRTVVGTSMSDLVVTIA